MNVKIVIYWIICSFLFIACEGIKNSKLLAERPIDMEIYFIGSSPLFSGTEELFFSEDSCNFYCNGGSYQVGFNYKMSKSELDSLYAVFVKYKFDLIDDSCDIIYDITTNYITLNWDNVQFTKKSNSEMINEKHEANFDSIRSAINKIINDNYWEHTKKINIEFDSLITRRLEDIELNGNEVWLSSEEKVQPYINKTVYCLPGVHFLSVESNGNTRFLQFNSDSVNNIQIILRDSIVSYKLN